MAEGRTMANGEGTPLGGSDLPLLGPLSRFFPSLVKIFGPASVAYLFISITYFFVAGYFYANTYYDRFGLQLHEIGIGYLEVIEVSMHIFRKYNHYAIGASVILVVFFTVAYINYISSRHGASPNSPEDHSTPGTSKGRWNLYLTLALALMLFGSIYVSAFIGHCLGNQYATRIVKGIEGRTAYCELRKNKYSEKFRKRFKEVTNEHRVIKIKETETMMYLFVVPQPEELEESDHGESFGFHKSDISYCRVAGTSS